MSKRFPDDDNVVEFEIATAIEDAQPVTEATAGGAAKVIRPQFDHGEDDGAGGGGRPPGGSGGEPPAAQPEPGEFTQDAAADELVKERGEDLLYCAEMGRFFLWDDNRWSEDRSLEVADMARLKAREIGARSAKAQIVREFGSQKTASAVVSYVKSDQRTAVLPEQFDADPMKLCTPSGTFDLASGLPYTSRRDDFNTKMTAVAPGGDCPLFLETLKRCMDGDEGKIGYLQRLFGYGLTGSIKEHSLHVFYGTGANGKSVITNTIAWVMGDYAKAAPMEIFMAATGERHPTELASLRGARFVTSMETEEGRRWSEARIKQLTGGDPIAARFMRQDFFEFTPVFKLVIVGNHKPRLRAVDEAIRRRLQLLHWSVTIPEQERDDALPERLKAEGPGILAWMLDGATEWALKGLVPPDVVRDATREYFEAEDSLGQWLEECCERDPAAWASSSELYASWHGWAERAGEWFGTQKRLIEQLKARGFEQRRDSNGRRGVMGLRVTSGGSGAGDDRLL